MSLGRLSFAGLALLVVTLGASEVGSDGRLQDLELRGHELIPASALILALAADREVTLARHPLAVRGRYPLVLAQRLEQGYRASGFPDATVLVTPADGGWTVEIEEGRRRFQGAIRFEGETGTLNRDALRSRLSVGDEERDPVWGTGEPLPSHEGWKEPLRRAIDAWLLARGRHAVVYRLAQDLTGEDGVLVLHVEHPGRQTTVTALRCEGLEPAQAQRVEAALAPLLERPADSETLTEAWNLALATGRVLRADVSFSPTLVAEGSELVVAATPLPTAPTADAELDPLAREVLAATAGLATALRAGERGLALDIGDPGARIRLLTIGEEATIALETAGGTFGWRVGAGGMRLVCADGRGIDRSAGSLEGAGGATFSFTLGPSTGPEELAAGKMTVNFNLGWTSSGQGWSSTITIHPAALLAKVAAHAGIEERGDVHRVLLPGEDGGEGWLELDRSAGLLTALAIPGVMGQDHAVLRFVAPGGSLALSEPRRPLAIDAAAPFAGWVVALLDELLARATDLATDGMFDGAALTPAQHRRTVAVAGVLLPALERSLRTGASSWSVAEDVAFHIPADYDARQHPIMAVVFPIAGRGLALLEARLPDRSWPLMVLRELVAVTGQGSHHTGTILQRLYASPELGPIGSLAIGRLLAVSGGGPGAVAFAERGLRRLDRAAAAEDLRQLQPLLAPVIAELDADARAVLAHELHDEVPALLTALETGEGIEAAMGPLWDRWLAGALRSQLEALLPEEAPAEPTEP